jgi:hypothetical protein
MHTYKETKSSIRDAASDHHPPHSPQAHLTALHRLHPTKEHVEHLAAHPQVVIRLVALPHVLESAVHGHRELRDFVEE